VDASGVGLLIRINDMCQPRYQSVMDGGLTIAGDTPVLNAGEPASCHRGEKAGIPMVAGGT
jgi:hypothetical protein